MKPCDACQTGNAVIYCRADSAFLCCSCDNKVHCANKLASRHERVLICDVCEHAPAAVTCKADAAALCIACDRDIHSANPLARRHERVPIAPFPDSGESSVNPKPHEQQQCSYLLKDDEEEEEEESSAAEAASWLLPQPNNPAKNDGGEDAKLDGDGSSEGGGGGSGDSSDGFGIATAVDSEFYSLKSQQPPPPKLDKLLRSQHANFDLFSDEDSYLDMDFLGALHSVTDSLVPIHTAEQLENPSPVASNASGSYDLDKGGHGYCPSLSLSASSVDVGVVPDASDISTPQSRAAPSLFGDAHPLRSPAPATHATPLEPMAREARVLRYREKRKNRKFEKTIRYASRKAYAETRPRIKGRFAKRGEMESFDAAFGVVPSF